MKDGDIFRYLKFNTNALEPVIGKQMDGNPVERHIL